MGEVTGFKNHYIYTITILMLYVFGVGFIRSELLFYFSVMLIGCMTLLLLYGQGHRKIFRLDTIHRKTILAICLGFVALTLWSIIVNHLFPVPENEKLLDTYSGTGIELYLFYIYGIFIGPISEELVFRALIIKNLERFSSIGLDLLVSAVFFSLAHTVLQGFNLSDFIVYFGFGLIYSILFKRSKTLYPALFLHIIWNAWLFWVSS
ncbi:CPBP family intramembrane glutamic endopeptidase [Streptococcus saliviloxodontae]|uniref:Membrane protease YdiL (CAAX protease family) n=1 Tax=Streptococcus saliviloxodontae TaxID=1349416 RepID=A0ABS2PKD3_9STRE|nr:type II CAAX endopeptidase family protein [Streptococcus saliviloxodontae]MBM7635551.1 membrane protease YdiL (CAAX protease family) [Streptococcus saliviloxodontae]